MYELKASLWHNFNIVFHFTLLPLCSSIHSTLSALALLALQGTVCTLLAPPTWPLYETVRLLMLLQRWEGQTYITVHNLCKPGVLSCIRKRDACLCTSTLCQPRTAYTARLVASC